MEVVCKCTFWNSWSCYVCLCSKHPVLHDADLTYSLWVDWGLIDVYFVSAVFLSILNPTVDVHGTINHSLLWDMFLDMVCLTSCTTEFKSLFCVCIYRVLVRRNWASTSSRSSKEELLMWSVTTENDVFWQKITTLLTHSVLSVFLRTAVWLQVTSCWAWMDAVWLACHKRGTHSSFLGFLNNKKH